MFDFLINPVNGTPFEKGVAVMLGGMLGVFIVLIIFYFLIKLITRLFPYKPEI